MKLAASTAALAAILATSTAAPLVGRQGSSDYISPTVISQYNVWTGAISFDTSEGKIFKDGRQPDITTLVTFDFPDWTEGRQCEFTFELDSTAQLSGSKLFDVFTSLGPATESTKDWPHGNLRDQHAGRMRAFLPGFAEWVFGVGPSPKFDCPTGQTLAGELVGVYDVDHIEWDNSVAGPRIHVT